MGLTRAEAQSSLRLGLGWSTTREDVDCFVDALIEVVNHLRKLASWSVETDQISGASQLQREDHLTDRTQSSKIDQKDSAHEQL
jgi:hypothetical protein